MCGSSNNMGLVGVWPCVPAHRLHRHHCPRKKRRCLAGKRTSCFRSLCSSADFSAGLSKHLKHLSIFHQSIDGLNMPGGFENSSMKTSFSLSSLQPSSVNLEGPGHATLRDRPYSSLRKKPRRDPELDLWRRSWESREENRDDAWNVLKQVNYQSLISDNNLIDSCQEARKDLLDGAFHSVEWNLSEFTDNFLNLNEWLDRIQETVYPKSDTVMDKQLRLSHMEEMKRKDYIRKLFNNQGGRLVAREPALKEEVAWRMAYLNRRWERLEAAVSLRKRTSADSEICPDVEHELRGLRKWIKETERRLTVLKLIHNDKLSVRELEERSREEEIIRREVWSHGKIVRSLLRLCERLSCGEEGGGSWVPRGRRIEREDVAKYAQGLEKRWQLLYLDCLELECAIQHRTTNLQQGSPLSANIVDSDEEPVTKHRRLTDSPPRCGDEKSENDECDGLMDAEDSTTPLNVDEVMEVEADGPKSEVTTQQPNDRKLPIQLRIADVTIIADDNLSPRPEMPITLDVIDDRKLYIDEIAKYTRSDCNGRVGTFYFMHKDTDTETDGGRGERGAASSDAAKTEESSEEEWTYTTQTKSSNCYEKTNECQPEIVRTSKEIIKQLVIKAEKMVLNSPQRVHHKAFVEEWLHQYPEDKTVGDSCDASWEYTTEDDELESRVTNAVDSSNQELDTTLVNRSSLESLGNSPENAKVVLRVKKKEGRGQQRPWSVSGAMDAAIEQTKLPHSISESAIHNMTATIPCVKMDSSIHTGSTLSSSTVEDTAQTQEGSGGGYGTNSLRRRKLKLRKRTAGRKSESGSEGLVAHSDSSHLTIGSPVKLPLLKSSPRRSSTDKNSDRRYIFPLESPSSCSSTSSDGESDVSVKMRRKISAMPSFKIGPAHTLSAYAMDRKPIPVSNDSSYSEQAWDNYQEKYMSEPYSEEPPDSEAARRLLEFGDDYRNFLDSQSDCASSGQGRITFQRRPRKFQHTGETDCDLIRTSRERFHFCEQVFKNQLCRAAPHLVLASDFAELVSSCKENIKELKSANERLEDSSLTSEQEYKEIRGLVERWEGLEKKSEDLQKVRFFGREISALKEQLLEIGDRVTRLGVKVDDKAQLELRIEDVQREVGRLKSLKPSLLQVNVAVHRFLTETNSVDGPNTLKEEVADLYSTFEDTCARVFAVEENLKDVTKAWHQFESYLSTLQIALRSDSENLQKLDEALTKEEGVGGKVSTHITSSVKDLAKLLSEKEQADKLVEPHSIYDMMTGGGGNYSDSGISDSGSEFDLSEREKRLALLRRLVTHLEAVLAPGSAAIVNMSKRIEQTEKELRGLQVTCRELIDRTNVYVESKAPSHLVNGFAVGDSARGKEEDCSGPGAKIKAWLWRAIRAGLPLPLAVMAILCIACLLEPQCCDAMNSFPYTMAPQLRYVKGLPPS